MSPFCTGYAKATGWSAFKGCKLSIFGACSHFLEFYLLTLRGGLCHTTKQAPKYRLFVAFFLSLTKTKWKTI